jgi:hypothetical protein
MGGIRFAVVSMSARSPEGRDAEYIEWHGLDHHPEQYGIDSIRLGQRWVSTPACRAARVAEHERFAAVDHVMQYLFADPSDAALDEFFALGAELHAAGRMPIRLPAVELGGYDLVERCASARVLIRDEVLPWRPVRGGYLIIERGDAGTELSALCDVPGVAGAWRYRGGAFHKRFADTSDLTLTVCYLDDDVTSTASRLGAVLAGSWRDESSALLAAPFEAVVPWSWDRALPG